VRIGTRAKFQRCDAPARDDDRRFAARGLHQPRQPAFQAKAVDDNDLCVRDLFRVPRCRRIDVYVTVGANQSRQADAVSADITDEVAQDRKAGDDVEAILRAGG